MGLRAGMTNLSNLPIIEPACSLVAIPTELSQFTRTVACLSLISSVCEAVDRIIRQCMYGFVGGGGGVMSRESDIAGDVGSVSLLQTSISTAVIRVRRND
jgi:hypothetical protein